MIAVGSRSFWAFLFAFLVGTFSSPLSAPYAAAATCVLTPVLRSVTINQGLGSYSPAVRGKETLFRAFLSKPQCAGANDRMTLTSAALTVKLGTTNLTPTAITPTPALVQTFPEISPYAVAPQVDWVGDPIFVIPGSVLAPSSTIAAFTLTFTITVGFTATAGAGSAAGASPVTFATPPGAKSGTITLSVDKQTRALRILVQPMGDPTLTFDSQLSAAAQSAVQDGMLTLSRIAPVPDGVGALGGTSGGVRYLINRGILDMRPFLLSTSPAGRAVNPAKFCGTSANFDAVDGVKAKLDQFLQAWNTANPTLFADRVLGVVDESLSLGASDGCAEGMAAATSGAKQAWTRALYSTSPSMTGGLTAMEIFHTGGGVPSSRYDPYNPWHSPSVAADGTSPFRAYNVPQRAYMANGNRSVMDFSSGFNNTNTLAEAADYAYWRCLLGGTVTSDCTAPGTVGTSAGVAASPTLTATGNVRVDTGGNQTVTDANTYFTIGIATPPIPSPLQLVQINEGVNPAATLRSDLCPISFSVTNHLDQTAPTALPAENNTNVGTFFCAYPFETATTLIRLVKNGAVVYERRLRAQPPAITDSTVTGSSCAPTFTRFAVPTPGSEPFKIMTGPDGNLWFTEFTADKIGTSTTGGTMTEYDIPNGMPASSLGSGRSLHTATLLFDGRVLVAGGYGTSQTAPLASAELYDPVTNTWTPTGSMNVARGEQTGTLLNNGKVLVAGGLNPGGFLTSAELWDPATGVWTATGSLTGARYRHTATRLGDTAGTVLVAAGWDGGAILTAERYDPGTGVWSAAASLGLSRVDHTATKLGSGKVFAAGGLDGNQASNTTEIYDPVANTWTAGPVMNDARFQHVAVLLNNGKGLVAGSKTKIALASAELYEPVAPRLGANDIATGPDGSLWFTEMLANRIGRITTAGAITQFNIPTAQSSPRNIVEGSDGNLWFTENNASQIGRVTVSGIFKEYPTTTSESGPRGIATGPDGNLWFTESFANKVGKLTPLGTVTEYSITTFGSDARGIIAGADGNLWFTENNANQIGKVTTSGVVTEYDLNTDGNAGALGVALGPDGNVWFAEFALNELGMITTAGVITHFSGPVVTAPTAVWTGPDGNIWFTQTDALGRLALCGAVVHATFGAPTPDGRGPADGRLDVFSCGTDGICYPMAVALPPNTVGADGSATFAADFNTSSCAGGTLTLAVNNGIQRTSTDKPITCTTAAPPPITTIDNPLAGKTFLSYDVIPLKGTATSRGVPIGALQFSAPGLAGSVAFGGAVDLTPPTNGWTPGPYTITLTATAGSQTGTASATITILKDSAHVGRSDAETDILPCKPAATPFAPFGDYDGDGIPNVNDPSICTKATFYNAVAISVPPRLTAQSTSILIGMVVPFRSVSQINGSTVRIATVAGKSVGTTQTNTGWTVQPIPPDILPRVQAEVPGLVDNLFAGSAFDPKKLADYLRSQGINNRSITLDIEGQSSGTSPWTFRTSITIFVAL